MSEAAVDRFDPNPSPPMSRMARGGPWFAGLWLFFLLDPLLEGWDRRSEVQGVLGLLATIAFGAAYMSLWVRARRDTVRMVGYPPLAAAAADIALQLVLAVLMIVFLGETGVASAVYLAIGFVMVVPFRYAAPAVLAIMAAVLVLGAAAGWGSQAGTAFGVLAASVAIFGLRTVLARNIELVLADERNAALAVENERTRFARDLHDILGHSLTVITVKAELAGRLMDVDLGRARSEVADLERLSRDALADVRRAVEGYREITLPGELARARIALQAAEIDANLPNSTDEVPSELRDLFAWTIREGITNVIRHSGARSCRVELTSTSAEVRDDGRGAAGGQTSGQGSGLIGLRERAAAAGAVVLTRDLEPGFALTVGRS